jgi:hypothetical protein
VRRNHSLALELALAGVFLVAIGLVGWSAGCRLVDASDTRCTKPLHAAFSNCWR